MSGVKLPREVVDAIDHISKNAKNKELTKYGLLEAVLLDPYAAKARGILIDKFEDGPCWDVLMAAIVNGYEVEETPEDKVRDYCEKLTKEGRLSEVISITGVLTTLNITIDGVNA